MIIKESTSVVDVAANIAECTDVNDHTGAVIELAKFLKNKKAEKALLGITEVHNFFGHAPQEMIKLRSMIYDQLMKYAEQKLSDEDVLILKHAF